ncbi:MAG: UPF0158 family protein [Proteobacteria bacterium]|nr:UPF0158 family protein [Pseudomonadota bacterium]
MSESSNKHKPAGKNQVPIAWEALEDAFENNAPEVHSYLHLATGEVVRIVDGVADPAMHRRILADSSYVRVDAVSSREQYRWMERFIATVDQLELRRKLVEAIDGKGAFRRFKDVLMSHPIDRERWFVFRSERLRTCMAAWLEAHGIEPVERTQWHVPTADEVKAAANREEAERPDRRSRAAAAEALRSRLLELAAALPVRELDTAVAYLEFLRERRHLPRAHAKLAGAPAGRSASAAVSVSPGEATEDSDAAQDAPSESEQRAVGAAGSRAREG